MSSNPFVPVEGHAAVPGAKPFGRMPASFGSEWVPLQFQKKGFDALYAVASRTSCMDAETFYGIGRWDRGGRDGATATHEATRDVRSEATPDARPEAIPVPPPVAPQFADAGTTACPLCGARPRATPRAVLTGVGAIGVLMAIGALIAVFSLEPRTSARKQPVLTEAPAVSAAAMRREVPGAVDAGRRHAPDRAKHARNASATVRKDDPAKRSNPQAQAARQATLDAATKPDSRGEPPDKRARADQSANRPTGDDWIAVVRPRRAQPPARSSE